MMGCFFGCFRVKGAKANLVTPSEPAAPRSKNALSSLFLCDDETLRKGEEARNRLTGQLDVGELKDEAKILKASGNLPETPAEFNIALEKWEGLSAPYEVEKASKFNSWLPNGSIEKLKLEKQSDELVTGSGSTLDSPSSCMTDGHNTERASSSSIQRSDVQNVVTSMDKCDSETCSEISSVSTRTVATSGQCENKSFCLHHASDSSAFSSKGYSSECVSTHSKHSGSAGMPSVFKSLPYPTPIRLTEEMQTPDTLFPAIRNDTTSGQVSNVRSQYASTVLHPAENPVQSHKLKDENTDSNNSSEPLHLKDENNLTSTTLSDLSVKEDINDEASLSSWFKPVSAKQNDINKRFVPSENVNRRKTPLDRPILGMVAAHWNDDETSHISPKWWDGKGIPNSTNKYKEDQKVNWHATPFEERLEKALSEETIVSQRKHVSRTSDTALSHLQSSDHLKSVVSF